MHIFSRFLPLPTAVRNASSKIGFVGLGVMGSNMATNLVKNGRELVVFDVNPKAMDTVVAAGTTKTVTKAGSAKEVAEKCSHVFTMLPTNNHVLEVYSNPKIGLVAGAKKGNYLIDSSTVSPDTSKRVHELASKAGVNFHDAPVSGAEPAAIAATLTFMVIFLSCDICAVFV